MMMRTSRPGRRSLLLICAMLTAIAPAAGKTAAKEADHRPNILVIVADDLGYSDLGAFGSEIRTPNLDRLARGGVRFTNFHTAPTCSPTRSMLLSGLDNHRVGLGTMLEVRTPNQAGKAGYEGHLSGNVETIAAALAKSGYQTFMAGKWHLGMDEAYSPAAFGFQRSFALLQGAANHFGADQGAEYEQRGSAARYREDRKLTTYPVGQYSTDYYTDRMIGYLRSREPGKAFFGYLAYTAPHWPLQAPSEDIARYHGRYDAGPEALHAERVVRMRAKGLIGPSVVPARYPYPDWNGLAPEKRAAEARKMEIFAAMVDRMDQNVGRLLDALRDAGQLDNTIIIFMSDNGPDGLNLSVPIDAKDPTRAIGTPVDNSLKKLGAADSYVSYGPDWAHAGAAPLAGIKGATMEGGIRTPAFIWGRGIDRSKVSNETVHVLDIYPTILALAHANGNATLEGQSWRPLVMTEKAGRQWDRSRVLYWELFDRRAVRDGRWKALYHPTPFPILSGSDDRTTVKWELYDIAADPGETRDLAAKHPGLLARLVRQWDDYAKHVGVVPPRPASDRKAD